MGAGVFDFREHKWSTLPQDLPISRADDMTAVAGTRLAVIGGESAAQISAHAEVEACDTASGRRETQPPLSRDATEPPP